jgi:hypothetical protein
VKRLTRREKLALIEAPSRLAALARVTLRRRRPESPESATGGV